MRGKRSGHDARGEGKELGGQDIEDLEVDDRDAGDVKGGLIGKGFDAAAPRTGSPPPDDTIWRPPFSNVGG
jgi:hypothetical protein